MKVIWIKFVFIAFDIFLWWLDANYALEFEMVNTKFHTEDE